MRGLQVFAGRGGQVLTAGETIYPWNDFSDNIISVVSNNFSKISHRYVVQRNYDFVFFGAPILFCIGYLLFLPLDLDNHISKNLGYFLFVHLFINVCHVLMSVFVLMTDSEKAQKILKPVCYRFGLLVTAMLLLKVFNRGTYHSFIAYSALFHIIMQLYGWIKISTKEFKNNFVSKVYIILFFLIAVFSLLFWHTGESVVSRWYYYPNSIRLIEINGLSEVSKGVTSISAILFLLLFVYQSVKSSVILWGTLYSMVTLWLVFSFGLLESSSSSFFWFAMTITHGWPYHFFVLSYRHRLTKKSILTNKEKKWWATSIGLGILWYIASKSVSKYDLFEPLIWLPLLFHYAFDSLAWKRANFVGHDKF